MSLCRIFHLAALLAIAVTPAALDGQASTVILVRHAEKAAPSADPDLTEAGRARAEELAVVLGHFPLQAVIVSEYRRTRQTADPTAAAHHLIPIVVPARGDANAGADAVTAALRRLPAGSAALIVGHSNTLGPIIAALGGPRIPDLCDGEHATLFLLELRGAQQPPRLLRASYGAADPPEAVDCAHQIQLH